MSNKPTNEDLGSFANSLQGEVNVADSHFDHPIDGELTIDDAGVELTVNAIGWLDEYVQSLDDLAQPFLDRVSDD